MKTTAALFLTLLLFVVIVSFHKPPQNIHYKQKQQIYHLAEKLCWHVNLQHRAKCIKQQIKWSEQKNDSLTNN